MDLEQISPNLNSFFILLGKIRGERARWRHFYAIKVFNIIATVVFFVLGVFLIVAYIINKGVEEELKEAANFDKWSPFILSSGSDFEFKFCFLQKIFRDFLPVDVHNLLYRRFEGSCFCLLFFKTLFSTPRIHLCMYL